MRCEECCWQQPPSSACRRLKQGSALLERRAQAEYQSKCMVENRERGLHRYNRAFANSQKLLEQNRQRRLPAEGSIQVAGSGIGSRPIQHLSRGMRAIRAKVLRA